MANLIPYNKRHLSLADQVALLKAHGLIIHNESYAKECLIKYNYYRLTAYWHIFKQPDPNDPTKKISNFESDKTFEEVILLYKFDEQLRSLIFEAIIHIETFLRTQIAFILPMINNDAFCVYDPNLFQNRKFNHQNMISHFDSEVKRAEHEDFIQHFKGKYSNYPKLPIWILTEVLSFGTLKNLYRYLKAVYKQQIVNTFNVNHHHIAFKDLDSYLYLIQRYRNICAHHGRVWNRAINNSLNVPAANALNLPGHTNGGLYALLIVLARLLEPTGQALQWKNTIESLIRSFPTNNSIFNHTTLPPNWKEHEFWT